MAPKVLPPELLRKVARTAHPGTTRAIKRLNRFLNDLITKTDLQFADTRWRLQGGERPNKCLFWAVRNGYVKMAAALLVLFSATNGEVEGSLWITARDKDIALVWAAGVGSAEVVSLLLSHGADMNAARNPDANWEMDHTICSYGQIGNLDWNIALSMAARNGRASVVSLLIDAGAEVDAEDGDALYAAIEGGHCSVVSLLLKAGATIQPELLSLAAQDGRITIVSLLLEAGADVHLYRDRALRGAAANGWDLIVARLLQAGANVHARNDEALRTASEYGYKRNVALLLAAGADVHALGDEALQMAQLNGHETVVSMLLEAGATAVFPRLLGLDPIHRLERSLSILIDT